MKGFILAAASSNSGKTLVALGIIAALKARGLDVAGAKCGPDYIDPRFLEAASRRPCPSLDPWAMRPELLRALAGEVAAGADVLVVEGAMGLFDGGAGGAGSTADLAAMLGLPVVLVLDAAGTAQSLGAAAKGFAAHRHGVHVAGGIANRVGSDRHAALVAEGFGDEPPLLGAVRREASLVVPSRHLGLVQAMEHDGLADLVARAATRIAADVDLDALLDIAAPVRPSEIPTPLPPLGQRIAVACDVAFAFAYPHVLEGWRRAGAEILPFSPLADEAPDGSADAVFLPGGYPELHAGSLAANGTFLKGVRGAAEAGATIYGECGGYMALGDGLADAKGARHAMLGLLPLETSFERRRLSLGYRRVHALGGPFSGELRGHEFHYASVLEEGDAERLFEASDAEGAPLGPAGLRRGTVSGSFLHLIDVHLVDAHLVDTAAPRRL